jgi:hypothetical protein
MRTNRSAIALVAALAVLGAGDLLAQRRTTEGGGSGSGTRQQPGGGGSGSSTGGSRPSSSGSGSSTGSATRRGGDERATPQRSGGSSGSATSSGNRGGDQARGSQTSGARATSGKIGAIRNNAQAARITTNRGVREVRGVWVETCFGCSYWGWYNGYWGWYHGGWWYPGYYPRYHRPSYEGEARVVERSEEPSFGQTYLDHPYAEGANAPNAWIQHNAPGRRGYGALTMHYFGDRGSETEAGRFTLEGGYRMLRGEIGYSRYAEPVAGGVDRLHTWRASAGVQPRLGSTASLTAAVAVRGVELSGGDDAYGPEAELGLQLLPGRPLGINVNGRLATLSWTGPDNFTFRELNTTGSIFVGRVELQAGWHYMKVGSAPAFTGPIAGLRVWF